MLDVGVGGGATSIPLAGRAGLIVGVDGSAELLTSFRSSAAEAGVRSEIVLGTWPEVADEVRPVDVAVCGHVLYNVWELAPFVEALDSTCADAGRARADRPASAGMDARPVGDVPRVSRGRRVRPPTTARGHSASSASPPRGTSVCKWAPDGSTDGTTRSRLIRRRLCLPAERDPEVAAALGDRLVEHDGLWSAGPPSGTVVTLWWDRTASDG